MSLRLEQNWKWSTKTFLHTLCVVSPWDETIVRFKADELLLFFKNHVLRPMVNLCKLLSPGNQAELNLKTTLSSKVNRFVGKGFILDK